MTELEAVAIALEARASFDAEYQSTLEVFGSIDRDTLQVTIWSQPSGARGREMLAYSRVYDDQTAEELREKLSVSGRRPLPQFSP